MSPIRGLLIELSVAAECNDEVFRPFFAGVLPAMLIVGSDVDDRTWSVGFGAAQHGHFQGARTEHHQFFMHVLVGRVWGCMRSQFRHVQLNGEARVGRALEYRARFVRAAGFNRKFSILVGFCGNLRGWRRLGY